MKPTTNARGGKGRKWWHHLPSSEQDPISLEPLRRLRIEPFVLEEDGHDYRFDGRVLAAYLVASQQFVNPLTRRELDLGTCARLDAHLDRNGCRSQSVARAWELSKEPGAERERLRTEAQAVMQALFVAPPARTLREGFEREQTLEERLDAATRQPGGRHEEEEEEPREEPPARRAEAAFPALPEGGMSAANRNLAEWAAARKVRPEQQAQRAAQRAAALEREDAKRRDAEAERRSKARMDRLASAFGVRRDGGHDDVRWPAELISWARGDRGDDDAITTEALKRLERRLERVVQDRRPADLAPTRDARTRARQRDLVDFYCLSADEFDDDSKTRGARYLRVRPSRRFPPRIPKPLLSQVLDRAPPPPPLERRRPPSSSSSTTTRGSTRRTASAAAAWSSTRRREARDDRAVVEDAPPEPAKNVFSGLLDDSDDDDEDDEADENGPSSPERPPSRKKEEEPRRVTEYESTEAECPICLCQWASDWDEEDDDARPVVLQCGHKFHAKCLRNWSQIMQHNSDDWDHDSKSTSCPQCRQLHIFERVPLPARRWSNFNAAAPAVTRT